MKLLFENWKNFLEEEVKPFTNTATVYHSFGIGESWGHKFPKEDLEKVVRSISNEGFKPGGGQLYGKGVYTVLSTKDLNSKYGKFSLIFDVVNLDKFLVLNYREAKKIKANQSIGHTLKQQMERLGILITDELDTICKKVDYKNRDKFSVITSEYALALSKMPQVKEKIRGFIFEGFRDGQVLVGYYPEDFSVTGYGEVHVSESTSYKDFIVSKDFIDKMSNFYKPEDPRIDPRRFAQTIRSILSLSPPRLTSAAQIVKTLDSELMRFPARESNIISDEAYDDLAKKIYGPSFYKKYQAYLDSDVFDDEAEEEFAVLLQNSDFEEKEKKFFKLVSDMGFEEIKRFFSRGYYDGMKRKFNLSDEVYIKNVKSL